jgi:hypothetical protein
VRFALPTKRQVLKGTGWLLGSIFVGALGSGVWQSILGPALHASTRWMLDLASLGFRSYKDAVYQQIATSNFSSVTVHTFLLVTVIYTILLAVVAGSVSFLINVARHETQPVFRNLADQPPASEEEREKLEVTVRIVRWSLLAFAVFLCVIVINEVIVHAKLAYISSADAHYDQVLRLSSPYLDAHERALVESEFAAVSKRDDYVRLLSKLEGLCKAHGQTVPKFDPW